MHGRSIQLHNVVSIEAHGYRYCVMCINKAYMTVHAKTSLVRIQKIEIHF